MITKKWAIAALAFTLMVSSCTKDDELDSLQNQKAASFRVVTVTTTKAVQEVSSLDNATIKVVAYTKKDGENYNEYTHGIGNGNDNFFYIKKIGEDWRSYSDRACLKTIDVIYPEDDDLVYFVAKYISDEGKEIPMNVVDQNGIYIKNYKSEIGRDMVVAVGSGKANRPSVNLNFVHVGSQVNFKAETKEANYKFVIKKFSLTNVPDQNTSYNFWKNDGTSPNTWLGELSGSQEIKIFEGSEIKKITIDASTPFPGGDDASKALFKSNYMNVLPNNNLGEIGYECAFDVTELDGTPVESDITRRGKLTTKAISSWSAANRYFYKLEFSHIITGATFAIVPKLDGWQDSSSEDLE